MKPVFDPWLYICTKCKDVIYSERPWQFKTCQCGQAHVDATEYLTRVLWDCEYTGLRLSNIKCDLSYLRQLLRDWKGWNGLMARVRDTIINEPDIYHLYIKEKYWRLDISYQWVSEKWAEILDWIEEESTTVCEVCWRAWKQRWCWWRLRTICLRHYIADRLQHYKFRLLNFLHLN